MNYGQLKTELIGIGFSDESELTEFGQIVPDAINRAITEINLNVAPIVGTYQIEQDGETDDLIYYNMTELTAEEGVVKFLTFDDVPVKTGTGIYKKFNDFEIENDDTIVMDGNIVGTFKVFYKKAHTPITLDTADETELELPLKVHYLVPLLSAYYVWYEDEQSKAVAAYNRYEELMQSIIADKEKPRMTILSGGI